jgi:hypothetical protein
MLIRESTFQTITPHAKHKTKTRSRGIGSSVAHDTARCPSSCCATDMPTGSVRDGRAACASGVPMVACATGVPRVPCARSKHKTKTRSRGIGSSVAHDTARCPSSCCATDVPRVARATGVPRVACATDVQTGSMRGRAACASGVPRVACATDVQTGSMRVGRAEGSTRDGRAPSGA